MKLLYLLKIFTEETDEDNQLSVRQLMERLEGYGIRADRRTIYSDIKLLQQFGLDITRQKRRTYTHFLGNREFELAEVKLLVDAVQSSRFITCKKTDELIRKMGTLVSRRQAQQLNRQVYIHGRSKTENERIYYNVDTLHTAIAQEKQVRFHYLTYTPGKQIRLHQGGGYYIASPYALTWNDDNYYVVTYYEKYGSISHFRVDKMMDIEILEEPRIGQEAFKNFDLVRHTRQTFGMFSGEECRNIRICFDNSLIDAVLDRFGHNVNIIRTGEKCFWVNINAVPSPVFYSWLFQFGKKATIVSPRKIKLEMAKMCEEVIQVYNKTNT